MKKVLVVVVDYPNNDGGVSLMYVHVRNKYYIRQGIELDVLNFSAKNDYVIDTINVRTLESVNNDSNVNYDILICHAANLKNHYKFLKANRQNFTKILFVFHGHEILKLNEVYPKPYQFVKSSTLKNMSRDVYDTVKLNIWKRFFKKWNDQFEYIFVSNWIYNKFLKYIKINEQLIKKNSHIIYNSVGDVFENEKYDWQGHKEYDFITFRNNLDGSKYGIDIVNNLAKNNPDLKFLVVGQGAYFRYNKKSENITWVDKMLNHEEMIELINKSKCGLLPTRQDTQGVMTCELLTLGMPVITSDIDVCHEVLHEFENVRMISNDSLNINLDLYLKELINKLPYDKVDKYFSENTSGKEVKLIEKFLENDRSKELNL